MKRINAIVATVAIMLASSANADQWTGQDKDKHAIAGVAIAAAVAAASRPEYGIAAGCAVGVAKEIADRYTPGRQASYKDAAVTCFGAAVGAYVPGVMITSRTVGLRFSF
jgi:VanZ family protein